MERSLGPIVDAGRGMRSAIGALEELARPGDDRRLLSAAAEHEWRMLQAVGRRPPPFGARERTLVHIERLETLLVESLQLAADQCIATADALALLEERCAVHGDPAWGMSARSAHALACRLRREAERRSRCGASAG